MSGWNHPAWRGDFYPLDLPQRRELEYAATRLTTIEINSSFYGLRPVANWRGWFDATPDDFVFSVKGLRAVTERMRPELPLAEFFASGVYELGEKLGPMLWQFSERRSFEPDWFTWFLGLLPREHDGRAIRHVIETRHPSFDDTRVTALARSHGIARIVAERGTAIRPELTADFTYVRLHGNPDRADRDYDETALDRWATTLTRWADDGRDCFAYVGGQAKPHSPVRAVELARKIPR